MLPTGLVRPLIDACAPLIDALLSRVSADDSAPRAFMLAAASCVLPAHR